MPGIGFCTGVCIDWARRVLPGQGTVGSVIRKRASFTQKDRTNQTVRQLFGQIQIKYQEGEVESLVIALKDIYRKSRANSKSDYCQIPADIQNKLCNYDLPGFTKKADGKYKEGDVLNWSEALSQASDHRTTAGWKAFVTVMDEKHKKQRQEQGRGESNRKFSSIKILESGEAIGTSVAKKIDSMIALEEFQAVTVLLMSFDVTKADGEMIPHAVAANLLNNGLYLFLDPNYGVYCCEQEKLKEVLYYLFAYNKGTPIYGEDGKKVSGGNYILFGPA